MLAAAPGVVLLPSSSQPPRGARQQLELLCAMEPGWHREQLSAGQRPRRALHAARLSK